jgi:hypothetical protein
MASYGAHPLTGTHASAAMLTGVFPGHRIDVGK